MVDIDALLAKYDTEDDAGRQERIDYLLKNRPTTKEDFREVVEVLLGNDFKGGIILAGGSDIEGHQVPLEWMYKAWCVGHNRTWDGEWRELELWEQAKTCRSLLLHGPRGGMKTLALACLWFLFCWYEPNYTITHTASEKDQSDPFMAYIGGWAKSDLFKEGIRRSLNKECTFKNGSFIKVLTASLRGLNAPHTLSISIDEVETFDLELKDQALQIQQEVVGYPLPSLIILASTQKKPNLAMSVLIEEAIKNGTYEYILWDVFDICGGCEDWRRKDLLPHKVKCSDYPMLVEKISRLENLQAQEPLRPPDQIKLEGARKALERLIDNCPLVGDCCGRAIGKDGHLAMNTLTDRITKLDRSTWIAENLCTRPAVKGGVYERLGLENLSDEAVYVEEGTVLAGVDYGFIDKAVVVLCCVHDGYLNIFYEAVYENHYEEDLIPLFAKLQRRYKVLRWTVGKDAYRLIRLMRKKGLNAYPSTRKRVITGCDRVAYFICDATGFRRMRFHPIHALKTFRQMEGYRKRKNSNEPEDGNDDLCDAVRYLVEPVKINQAIRPRAMKRPNMIGRSLAGRRQ